MVKKICKAVTDVAIGIFTGGVVIGMLGGAAIVGVAADKAGVFDNMGVVKKTEDTETDPADTEEEEEEEL